MSGPLDRVKVIDCTIWIQGAYASRILGDLGADVIKVEEKIGGDPVRGVSSFTLGDRRQTVDRTGRNYGFEFLNRNKRSITLDLRKDEGKEIIYKLVEKADIFLHNFRQGVAERLSIDYDTLSHRNSRLIYGHCSGWGMKGPSREKPALEYTAMARSGWMYHFGGREMPPLLAVAGVGDQMGGVTMAVALISALFAREHVGKGQFVDVSLLGSLIAAAGHAINFKLAYDTEYPRRSRTEGINPLISYFKCSDGKWIQLGMLQFDRFWPTFCKVMGIAELEKDQRFLTPEARAENLGELVAILDKVFATKPRDEWIKLFEEKGDILYSPIQSVSEVVTDPQVLANEYIMDYDHPAFGRKKEVGFPSKFSETPASIRRSEPGFGQHTEEVLLEVGGYTWEEIAQLRDEEVI